MKRVLARYHAVAGWPGAPRVERELWAHAEAHTPHARVADYTQAIMDLGATLCTRARPACTLCPLAEGLRGRARRHAGRVPRAAAEARARRSGRWPCSSCRTGKAACCSSVGRRTAFGAGSTACPSCRRKIPRKRGASARSARASRPQRVLATIEHAFTHFDLDLTPQLLTLAASPSAVMDRPDWLWYKPGTALAVGVPAPVAALLKTVKTESGLA